LKFKKNNITYKEKIIDNIERLKSMIIENENQDRDSIDTTITLLGLSENSIPATNSSTPNLESEESSFFKKNQNNQLFNTISNSFQSLFNENKNSFSSALPKIIKQKSYGAIRSVFASKPRTEQNSDQDPILLGQDTIANLLIPNSSVAGNINQERTQ
jgi:hypothetical protein